MATDFLGAVKIFAGNFAPKGWTLCQGQLTSIQQNAALFSLLGTVYGGNGTTTFALPDLRGRLPLHWGQGPGLSNYTIGETAGAENITLLAANVPSHNHVFNASNQTAAPGGPTPQVMLGTLNANSSIGGTYYVGTSSPGFVLDAFNAQALSMAGGNQPHTNIQPTMALTYILALTGIFPTRN
jgi:microcystin-dependent protein